MIYGAAGLRSASHIPGSAYTEWVEVSQGTGGGTAGIAVQDTTVAASGTTTTVDGTLSKNVDWAV
ncbi:hypothetical protein, partial [Escherichia coli]|uniref:hypothetical protein n=1 Tax=Escherichia coli TaxID=562 RepID=UPI001412B01A